MDGLTVQRLTFAWMRRKRWEAELTAASVISRLGRAAGESGAEEPARAARPGRLVQRVSAGEMLAMMGVKL